jgi:osmoprotectant transport system ATP-binding protein
LRNPHGLAYTVYVMIKLEKISKSYDDGETWAVRDLDLHIAEGELLILIGESGCGKTTTLKMINRLIEASSGQIMIDDDDVMTMNPVELRRRIGYVFQGIGLFPHYTIARNIGAVPRLLGWDQGRIADRVDEMLEMVNLPPDQYRDRMPAELSGGQQQRVGVARALAAEPRLMLLDEPFGALDPVTRAELQGELKRIEKKLKLTSVMVTHDMTEALLLADKIAVIDKGRLLQLGTPHELMTEPADEYVQTLVKMPKERADELESLMEAP